ncbi:MAG: hypothetical protein COW65_06060, partial [Cytophagales bacterium CG18_big_fil_WC_8_21_14_2_50_42_9]
MKEKFTKKQGCLVPLQLGITLLIWLLAQVSYAQTGQNIGGKITGETGEGLPGVTVLVKGSNAGTATDAGGNYALPVPANANTLVVSFIGFQTQEVAINNRSTI